MISGGHALVTDFGVAKAVSESSGDHSLTSLGLAGGTPAYMAPEQASGDPNVDHRADLYALGAMAFEMLTGAAGIRAPERAVAARGARDAGTGAGHPTASCRSAGAQQPP